MAANLHIIQILKSLDLVLQKNNKSPFKINDSNIILLSGREEVFKINNNNIFVAGENFEKNLNLELNGESRVNFDFKKFDNFLHKIENKIARLNHLGISFFSQDLNKEVVHIKSLLKNKNVKLYEEESGNNYQKWLFVGDRSNKENALFEIVLNKENKNNVNAWVPHFQIDIDTDLTIEEIEKKTHEVFGLGFVKWKLDIPNYGVVLAMGILGSVGSLKVAIGIGTNLRNTDLHRKKLLKDR